MHLLVESAPFLFYCKDRNCLFPNSGYVDNYVENPVENVGITHILFTLSENGSKF